MDNPLFLMTDGDFSFWVISDAKTDVVLRLRNDRGNSQQAAFELAGENGVISQFPRGVGLFVRPATDTEIQQWDASHPGFGFLV